MVSAAPMNTTSMMELVNFANEHTGHYFGVGILLAIFLIIFLSLKAYSTGKAFSASMFITGIFTLLFWSIGIVNNLVLLSVSLGFVIAFVIATYEGAKGSG